MARPGYDEVVLLTGFPSFGARKLCEHLVASHARTLVHAVVQKKFEADAREALDALPLEQRGRVNLLEGDAAAMDLGLSGSELKAVASEIDRIHHMAQVSYLGADRKLAEHVNVGGAREILELASVARSLQCLVFHSTAHVSGDRTGLVLEAELDKGQTFRNVVEETMARAEKMMRGAMSKVPIAVVRPTIVVGDSQTGEVDRFDGPYFLILLIVTSPPDFPMPLPGRADTLLHLVPADYYVRAACAIGRDPRARGRTFHIGDPSPLTTKRVFELVAAAGGRRTPRGFIPANLTKALLRTPGIDRLAKSPRAFIDALATPVTYSFANTTELLADTDVRCPPLESYVDGLVEYVQHRLREKRARDAEVDDPLV
ncbi:MAG: SDR family oxidoreductase [Labilithrix sp.]|nr:SDR family oxidoreductase [Labilithrix sp.]